MFKLIKYLKGYGAATLCAPLLKLIEAFSELSVPLVVAYIVDTVIPSGQPRDVYVWGGILLTLGAGGFMLALISQYLAARAGVGYGTNLRKAMYAHINRFSYAEIDRFGTESLVTRLTGDVRQTRMGVSMFIRLVLRAPFILIGAIVMAMFISIKMSLIFIGVALLIGVALYFIMSRTGKLYREIRVQLDEVSVLTRENLAGTRVVRAFSRQEEENTDFSRSAERLAKTSRKAGIIAGLLNPLTYVLINCAILLIIWLGGYEVAAGNLTAGQIIALVNYLGQILLALVVFANLLVTFTKASAAARRINEVLSTQPSLTYPDAVDALQPVADAPKIRIEGITFSYPQSAKDDAHLDGISVSVGAGQSLGIVGATGSGKTTLINLIARFYDVSGGAVFIDGHNVRDYPKAQLANKIGLVPQAAVLFNGSVRENMLWGKPDATDEEIWDALKTAQADEFVQKLSKGLDTVIVQGGKNLSGGQRQRLTIARALIKKPEIVILDDSSSALDYATDARLRKALQTDLNNATVLIVSQRAASVKSANQILVLEEGRMIGLGTHAELLETCEAYREICSV
ncbi:MAG: ABC transporter ATP-binding protein/permease [Firmicutes bacterium]|nr:ABC transporter ATP-binding protein/permease [Bacillota bacterium]